MTESGVPERVQRFLAEHIDSAERLEILLFLHRNPERALTAGEISPAVYTVPASATLRLEELVATGLAASGGGSDPAYRYAPASDALRAQVDELAEVYRDNRVGVIRSIYSAPRSSVQSFADAFRLRRDG